MIKKDTFNAYKGHMIKMYIKMAKFMYISLDF
jgi:hypothetical protein